MHNIQCATHLNLGWRIRVMDPDPVPTTVPDSEPPTTQAVSEEEIITDSATTSSSTVNEIIGEFTTSTTVTADEEQLGIGTAFDQVSANGGMTFNVFLTGLIIAVALAILTS